MKMDCHYVFLPLINFSFLSIIFFAFLVSGDFLRLY